MDNSNEISEKRSHQRVVLQQCVRVSLGREIFIGADGLNLSPGGILCSTKAPVYDHEKIFFMIDLPFPEGIKTVRVEGMIIHVRNEGDNNLFGVTFTDFFPGDQEILAAYLEQTS